MDGPGTITWEEFLENAKSFVRFSTTISDGWELRGDESMPGQAYLCRRVKDFLPSDDELYGVSNLRLDEADEEFEFEFAKDPLDSNSTIERPLIMEHHVLWSISYTVPVLYFNGWRAAKTNWSAGLARSPLPPLVSK
ncbi:hypothetical protein KM043_014543 [Ampulex compressa]|nr:hypothetical protein KM043_014543 [Ampulex compressa]